MDLIKRLLSFLNRMIKRILSIYFGMLASLSNKNIQTFSEELRGALDGLAQDGKCSAQQKTLKTGPNQGNPYTLYVFSSTNHPSNQLTVIEELMETIDKDKDGRVLIDHLIQEAKTKQIPRAEDLIWAWINQSIEWYQGQAGYLVPIT